MQHEINMAVFFSIYKRMVFRAMDDFYLNKQHVITAAALAPTEYYLVGNNMLQFYF